MREPIMSNSTVARRPLVAAALSLVSTGLGHVYCGRIVKGLTLFGASLLVVPLAVGVALLPPSSAALVVLILGAAGVIGLYFYAAGSAWRLARSRPQYELRDYNHAGVYLLLGVIGLVYPAAA